MKHFFSLLRHELHLLFIAPSTYIATVLFLFSMGVIYLLLLLEFSRNAQENLPSITFFKTFWLPVFFVVPLITMKSIAEERRLGTLETLLATPTPVTAVVLSKFLGAYIFYMLLWLSTLSFPFIVKYTLIEGGVDERIFDFGSLFGGYLFIAISGLLFIAVGIFSSSLTRSQLVAGILSFSCLFIFIIGGRLGSELPMFGTWSFNWLEPFSDYFQNFEHLMDFSRGVIDTRPLFYYASLTLLLLGLTVLIVESKK